MPLFSSNRCGRMMTRVTKMMMMMLMMMTMMAVIAGLWARARLPLAAGKVLR